MGVMEGVRKGEARDKVVAEGRALQTGLQQHNGSTDVRQNPEFQQVATSWFPRAAFRAPPEQMMGVPRRRKNRRRRGG